MLIRRAVDEVWNQGDLTAVDRFVASDFIRHSLTIDDPPVDGREGVKQFYRMLRAAFPDMHFTIDDLIAEGDRVVLRWSATGTHQGPFEGYAPTGKELRVTGIDINRVANGKLVECWTAVDDLGMTQQLGGIPSPDLVGS